MEGFFSDVHKLRGHLAFIILRGLKQKILTLCFYSVFFPKENISQIFLLNNTFCSICTNPPLSMFLQENTLEGGRSWRSWFGVG